MNIIGFLQLQYSWIYLQYWLSNHHANINPFEIIEWTGMVLVLLLRNVTRKVVQPLETVPQVLASVVYSQLDLRPPPVPLFHKTIPTYKILGSLLCILIPVQSLILSTNVPIVSIILREFTTKANILHTYSETCVPRECIHLLNNHKYCGNTCKYCNNIWKTCSPIDKCNASMHVSFEAILIYLKA